MVVVVMMVVVVVMVVVVMVVVVFILFCEQYAFYGTENTPVTLPSQYQYIYHHQLLLQVIPYW
jgi:flagellar basal body-associated protein FliL